MMFQVSYYRAGDKNNRSYAEGKVALYCLKEIRIYISVERLWCCYTELASITCCALLLYLQIGAEQVWSIHSCAIELVSFSTCLGDDFCHPGYYITPTQLLCLLDVLLARENTHIFRYWPCWRMTGKKYGILFQDLLLLIAHKQHLWMF